MRDVVYSCDEFGAGFLQVSLYSLLRHYRGDEPLRINILEVGTGFQPWIKDRLRSIVGGFDRHVLRFVNVDGIVTPYVGQLRQRAGSRWNAYAWTPVFAPDAIPDSSGNLLYLDIDTLVNADVSELFEMKIPLLAAVYENHRGNRSAPQMEWKLGVLPPGAERYFNDGVLVIDAARFREERCLEQVFRWYAANYDCAHRIEQDALNALFWNRTQPLSAKWNYHDRTVRKYCFKLLARFWDGNSPRDCLEAALRPAILHFWGKKKPWNPSHRPYRGLYHSAMRDLGMEVPPEQYGAWINDLINKLAHMIIIWRQCGMLMSGKWFE